VKKTVRIGVLVVLSIFLVLGFLVFKSLDRQTWKVYSNSRYNFRIEFPPSWELGAEETNNAGRVMVSKDEKIICYAYGFENALDQTLDELVTWLTDSDKVLGRKNTKLAGKPAVEVTTQTSEKITRKAVYTFLDDGSGRGFFCAYLDGEMLETHSKDFNRMRSSFE